MTADQAGVELVLEVKKPFFETQLELCIDAADAAAAFATALDPAAVAAARDRFEELYHGSRVLVEDRPVASAMVDYRKKTLQLDPETVEERRAMAGPALRVSNVCRDLIEKSWTLNLPTLRDIRD